MIQIIYGDEPYYISLIKRNLFSKVTYADFNISHFEAFDEAAYDSCTTYPVMDDIRVVFLDLDRLTQLDTPLFWKYLEKPSQFCQLLILVRNVDCRIKIYKELSKRKLIREISKLSDEKLLQKEILTYLQHNGGTITSDALAELIRRENYLQNEAVNLISVTNDILSMLNIDKNITLDMVKEYVRDNAVDNVFALAKLLLAGNSVTLRKELSLISSDQAIPTLGLLLREYRIAYKANFFKPKEIGVSYISFMKLPKAQLVRSMEICNDAIEGIKEGSLDAKVALPLTVGKLLQEGGKYVAY